MKTRTELIAEGIVDAKKWYEQNYEFIKICQKRKRQIPRQKNPPKIKTILCQKL